MLSSPSTASSARARCARPPHGAPSDRKGSRLDAFPILAPTRNKPVQVVAFIEKRPCYFEPDCLVPAVGETVEVMITRPVHPKDDRFFNVDRLTGLMIRVVDREHHALVAIDGFECSGSMCSTTAWGAVTDGSRAIGDRKSTRLNSSH